MKAVMKALFNHHFGVSRTRTYTKVLALPHLRSLLSLVLYPSACV